MIQSKERIHVRFRVEVHPLREQGEIWPTDAETLALANRLRHALMDGEHLVSESIGTSDLPRFLVTTESWR